MPKSANGWPVITDRAKLRKVKVPGTGVVFWLADDNDVVDILTAVAWWIDNHVEDLDTRKGVASHDVPDDWSWAVRLIRGAVRTISNHASGTAIDLNAVAHPMKVHNTWLPKQSIAIDAFLARFDGVVRWGEHYERVDGMHFEINTTDRARLKRAAAVARQAMTPAATAPAQPATPTQEDNVIPKDLLNTELSLTDGQRETLANVDPQHGRRMTVAGALFRGALSAWATEILARLISGKVDQVDAKVDALTAKVDQLLTNQHPTA